MEEVTSDQPSMNDEETIGSKVFSKADSKRRPECPGENTHTIKISTEKRLKESSNDVSSEILNPGTDNDSSCQATESQPVELSRSSHSGVANFTSSSSGNSSISNYGENEGMRDRTSGAVFTSHVTLEIPEHCSSSGVRRIKFKFSKTKDHLDGISFSDNQSSGHTPYNNQTSEYISEDSNRCEGFVHGPDSKSTMSDWTAFGNSRITVKKLLATGILEGARVKYTSSDGKALCGIITGRGYLCGCSLCNFSDVVSAYAFELHAGCKTSQPNRNIHLENGRSMHNVVQLLRTYSSVEADKIIKDILGNAMNPQFFDKWRARICLSNNIETVEKLGAEDFNVPSHAIIRKSAGGKQKKKFQFKKMKRDNELHQLLFMPDGIPEGTELAYFFKGKKMLLGYKQGTKIFCTHCTCKVSPSQFEAHAGWASRRQPYILFFFFFFSSQNLSMKRTCSYHHIYTPDGLSLHDSAVSLAAGHGSGDSDDMCTVCGDGGRLVCCRGCPRAFHAACLELRDGDEFSYCKHCRSSSASSSSPRRKLTCVVKEPTSVHGGCAICGEHDFTSSEFGSRTIIICDQCEREFHVICLRESGICDLNELPGDDWFCSDECGRIHGSLHGLVFNVAPSDTLTAMMRLDRPDTEWRILNGRSRGTDHLRLLSQATSIFRDCFDPILAVSGRDLIPVMVYGRNICGQEFGGMYCVVLTIQSAVVSSCLVRVFCGDVAELPLVATSRDHQGNGYFQTLFGCVQKLLSWLKVRRLVLPASADSEAIWIRKFGFRRMTPERLHQYRTIQFTVFKKTTLLEREVH